MGGRPAATAGGQAATAGGAAPAPQAQSGPRRLGGSAARRGTRNPPVGRRPMRHLHEERNRRPGGAAGGQAAMAGRPAPAPETQSGRSALGARRSALGARRSALGARRSALGARRSALGARRSALGARHCTASRCDRQCQPLVAAVDDDHTFSPLIHIVQSRCRRTAARIRFAIPTGDPSPPSIVLSIARPRGVPMRYLY